MSNELKDLGERCKKSIEHLKLEIGKLRTGRAHSSLLETIKADYYGSSVPLMQMGTITVPEPRVIAIQVYDTNAVEAIEKAIMQSDLGLTPSRDGSTVRVILPSLTADRRKELTKKLKTMGEDTKVAIRGHRRDILEVLKKKEKGKEISADELKRSEGEVQKITDKAVKDVDVVVEAKDKEIMEV